MPVLANPGRTSVRGKNFAAVVTVEIWILVLSEPGMRVCLMEQETGEPCRSPMTAASPWPSLSRMQQKYRDHHLNTTVSQCWPRHNTIKFHRPVSNVVQSFVQGVEVEVEVEVVVQRARNSSQINCSCTFCRPRGPRIKNKRSVYKGMNENVCQLCNVQSATCYQTRDA